MSAKPKKSKRTASRLLDTLQFAEDFDFTTQLSLDDACYRIRALDGQTQGGLRFRVRMKSRLDESIQFEIAVANNGTRIPPLVARSILYEADGITHVDGVSRINLGIFALFNIGWIVPFLIMGGFFPRLIFMVLAMRVIMESAITTPLGNQQAACRVGKASIRNNQKGDSCEKIALFCLKPYTMVILRDSVSVVTLSRGDNPK